MTEPNHAETTSLSDLLDRARSGDEAARNALLEKCRNYVRFAARAEVESWLQVKVDPSDLVQQTLLEAHQGLSHFRGTTEAEWLGWLRRILKHNALDFVRRYRQTERRQVGREVPLQRCGHDSDSVPGDCGPGPSTLIRRQEDEIQVADALSRLGEDYRDVLVLRNLEQLSFNQVAERMGRSRPAVQMLWMRALRKLRTELGEVGD